jgi:hypothetical protein
MSQFKYLGTTVTIQNFNQEEIKRRLNSAKNRPSYHLLPKNIQFGIYKITILPVVLYGCEIWSLTFNEEHRLRPFENMVLKKIFGRKRIVVIGG